MDLADFAVAVGDADPVTIAGMATRGGHVAGIRRVSAPAGIVSLEAEEMTIRCGAATPVDDVIAALAEVGQRVALPPGGTVGGALACGRGSIRTLGDGPMRDVLLQATFVNGLGRVVTAGGPTVKNVSGFDVCRLLVGSRGTLGFVGEVILRTRPLARASEWFTAATVTPAALAATLYRPVSMLWDGSTVSVLLEGHPADIAEQARAAGLSPAEGPPPLPVGRTLIDPHRIGDLTGEFLVEVGVGVVHGDCSVTVERAGHGEVDRLQARLKANFDPLGRLNPGVDV